jgi:nucleoid DNA-binding protein
MIRMPVTEADFNLQGRVDNYREQLFELLVALDAMVQTQLADINRVKLNGRGQVTYESRPPRWTLAWKTKGSRRIYEVNLMAFAQGGAWVIHGRMGLDRPFRNLKSVRERDEAALRQEIVDQVATDETVL